MQISSGKSRVVSSGLLSHKSDQSVSVSNDSDYGKSPSKSAVEDKPKWVSKKEKKIKYVQPRLNTI